MDIWIVLTEDRHSGADALPFSSEARATGYAMSRVDAMALPAELNEAMRAAGWVLYVPYGTEGDCVRVIKRAMDD